MQWAMWIAFLLVFQDLVLCQELTDTEAARLERLLIKSPENLQLRMRSVAVRQKRWKSAMWMVVHHPDHEQVFRSAARFTRALVGQGRWNLRRRTDCGMRPLRVTAEVRRSAGMPHCSFRIWMNVGICSCWRKQQSSIRIIQRCCGHWRICTEQP